MSIINDPDIVYFYVSAILDENTCQVCRKLNGLRILNDKSQLERIRGYEGGVKDCVSLQGCRCILVGVLKEEIGSDRIVADLKKAGGVLPKTYFEEKKAKELKCLETIKKRNDLVYELYNRGRELEKSNPSKATKIYNSIINNFPNIGPTYFLPAFLRLSLCYENEKKYKECLETIMAGLVENNKFTFHRFTQVDINSLLKRFDRCKEKYPNYNKQLPKVFNFSKWLDILYKFGFDNSDWEEVSEDLTRRFGERASLNDIAWSLFNKAIVNSGNSRSLYDLYNHMADFLEDEGREGSERLRSLANRFKL